MFVIMLIAGLLFQIFGAVMLISTEHLFVRRRERVQLNRPRDKAKFAIRARVGLWLIATGTITQVIILVRMF